MAAPIVRGVGATSHSAAGITPGLPTGTVEGDLLIAVIETRNQTITMDGVEWAEAPDSPQSVTGQDTTRLTIFWVIETSGGVDRTTNDSGNHQTGRIIGIQKDTFDAVSATPFDVTAGGTQDDVTAVSIPGDTTTIDDCLILAVATGHIPDAVGSTEFSGWTNSDLSSVTERMDDSTNRGDGGAFGAATGILATAGTFGATTATAVTSANRGVWSGAIAPAAAAAGSIDLTHLANTTFPTPTVADSSFQLATLDNTTFFSMQLDGEVVLDLLSNTTIFSPTLTSTIDLAHLANTTFFSPQLDGTIDLALLSNTTFPTPHVLSVLDMALLSGTTFFAVQLDGNIDLALLSSTVFPAIQLDGEILLTTLSSTTFPTFFVDGNIDLAHLASTVFFSPQLDGEILLTTLSGTVFPPIMVAASGGPPDPLDMDLLSSTTLFSIFLDGNIDLTHLANTTFFSPQLDGTIDLAHLTSTVIPSITVGEANIDLAHLSSTTLFSMNVDGNIDLAHLNNTIVFTLLLADSSIDLDLLSNTTIFPLTVVDPSAVAVGIQLPMRGVDR